ncbi:bifunctional NAD(P)/FAD-dependent oxidoreductase/class I SAM-dependent methyltransferase [Dietzia sp. PP-33]|jgi:thioredoxin reductase/SAM-dependent methyltransferase|uniref:bifunctional NAD(P)/FAD-dependent oxidoreductase/class I SAM-dependent methyltransferase n=1 Tax=Dietzia sp. PP-33 TaxID=2957500 RepID=UPI0029A7DC2D|nr:bifunctional NAD(P)/FAD-dependent oxidoreductase/class I SAM-dependent methyltransferase [Dietzia sp. PP-33]MDX2357997.1 NAD(P)/FAD-dependent oxidoreductase [Dietzia sp. PP-33]
MQINRDTHEHWDVIVVGGGAAGLSAALMLGRARRRVLVMDAGEPRNRFAAHMHGVLGHEGVDPLELLRRGREELREYDVTVRTGSVARVESGRIESGRVEDGEVDDGGIDDDEAGLTVEFTDTARATARALVVATGQTDQLPDIPGLREFWGTSVLHCPYCHGWEVRGRRLAVLGTSAMSAHQAQLVRQWTDDLVFLTAGISDSGGETHGGLDAEVADRLRAREVTIERTPVDRVLSEGGRLSGVRLADGREIALDAVFAAPTARPHVRFLDGLDLEQATTPMGTALAVDQFGATSHPRIWAAGNVTNPGATVPVSMAAGSMAGGIVNMALVNEDFDRALATRSADPAEHWESEYADNGPRWSGAVNATTASVVAPLPVGSALELGCGEGGDAVWLAEQGWRVTAVDLSPTAVSRGADAAAARGVADRIDWVAHDLATWTSDERVDLVTASFFHSTVELPRAEILRRAAESVRPGGHLLLVSHVFESEDDLPPWATRPGGGDHSGHGGHTAHRNAHPDLPTPAEEVDELALDPALWELVLAEVRPREAVGPDGIQTATLKDGVVLYRRRS